MMLQACENSVAVRQAWAALGPGHLQLERSAQLCFAPHGLIYTVMVCSALASLRYFS